MRKGAGEFGRQPMQPSPVSAVGASPGRAAKEPLVRSRRTDGADAANCCMQTPWKPFTQPCPGLGKRPRGGRMMPGHLQSHDSSTVEHRRCSRQLSMCRCPRL